MSQIDKIIYMPSIFWFIFLLLVIYFVVYNHILVVFLSTFKVRVLYFNNLYNLYIKDIVFSIFLLYSNKKYSLGSLMNWGYFSE